MSNVTFRSVFSRSIVMRLMLSAGVSFAILASFIAYLSAQGYAINLASLVATLRGVAIDLMLAYLVAQLAGAWFRAKRFQLLLGAAGEDRLPGFGHLYLVTMVRNMVVDLLPARLGELVYVALLNRGYRLRLEACVSSLAISVWLDLVILIPLLLVLALITAAGAGTRTHWLYLSLAAAAIVLLSGWLLYRGVGSAARAVAALTVCYSHRSIAALARLLAGLDGAIALSARRGVLWRGLGLSVAVRFFKYLGIYMVFMAVVRPNFPDLAQAEPAGVLLTLIAAELGASLPVPAFMGFGTYESGGLLALIALGFTAVTSTLAILAVHVASQFVDYLLGGLALLVLLFVMPRLRMRRLAQTGRTARGWLTTIVTAAVLLAGIALAGHAYRTYLAARTLVPPPTGDYVAGADALRQASRAQLAGVNGFVVWSSNRFGNHDILLMKLPEMIIRRLTSNPHSEYFPRVSPDGRQVAFARSQMTWVSQRDALHWDVYLVDIASGKERLLARNANQPTWSADGRAVLVQRDGGAKVVRVDLASGRKTELLRVGQGRLPANLELQTPSVNQRNGEIAVTLRGPMRMTAIVGESAGNPVTRIADGCQATWSPDGSFVYFVDHGGRMENKFYRYDPGTAKVTPWLDMPGQFSHEYFPKLSRDGRYLVFGASAGGHEHDTADYEIFLWKVGAPAAAAVRLTFHTGNDNWPDVYLAAPASMPFK